MRVTLSNEDLLCAARLSGDGNAIRVGIVVELDVAADAPVAPTVRLVPPRWIATLGQEVDREQLIEAIDQMLPQLIMFALRSGARQSPEFTVEEPAMVLYHGMIAPRRKVRVETALVLSMPVAAQGEIMVRQEPEHHEALLPALKKNLNYATMATAHEALGMWVSENGSQHISLPIREEYVVDVRNAAPHDFVGYAVRPFTPRRSGTV